MHNLSIYVIFDLMVSCFMLLLAVILLINALKLKYTHLGYLSLAWFSYSLCNFLFTFANMFYDLELFRFARNLVPFEVFCTILFVDFVSRESLDILKIVPLTIISGFLWSSSFESNIFYFGTYANGATSILTRPSIFALNFNILSLYWSLFLLIFMLRIYFESPAQMRKYSLWNVIATITIIVRGIFFYEIDAFLPGITFLMMGVSVLIMSNNFLSHPQLAFILPYHILRLAVVDARSGLELYSYNWQAHGTSQIMSDVVFSNVMYGINVILQQMVHKGVINEIHMEQGIVLLQRIPNSPLAFLLVTTKVSKILRNALVKFSEMFVRAYPADYDSVINVQQFDSAKTLLNTCFPFVPDYK